MYIYVYVKIINKRPAYGLTRKKQNCMKEAISKASGGRKKQKNKKKEKLSRLGDVLTPATTGNT